VGGRLLTVKVVLATPPTVVGATGARVPAVLGFTAKVAAVPFGAALPFVETLTDRGSELLGSSTLLADCTKLTLTGAAAGGGGGAGGAGVAVLSDPPPQPASAAVKASRDARRCVVFLVCMVFRGLLGVRLL